MSITIFAVLIILLFGGGNFFGYLSGYYGNGGVSVIGVIGIILLLWLLFDH